MKIAVGYGTRPEVIKLAPVILELKDRGIDVTTIATGQHTDLLNDLFELVPPPDYQYHIGGQPLREMVEFLLDVGLKSYDCIIIQGDTVSAFALALTAFYQQVPIAHIEAGLRTWDLSSPWPEEGHRQMIDCISDYLYCPSFMSTRNIDGRCKAKPIVVGQTALDMIRITKGKMPNSSTSSNMVLVTVHRRESFGKPIEQIFKAINNIAISNKDIEFIWPMHPNPEVQRCRNLITAENIEICLPLSYPAMVKAMCKCKFAMTDSGGLQEELPYLGKRVVVLRPNTERMEAVIDGSCVIAGYEESGIKDAFKEVNAYSVFDGDSPYGNGHAAEHIINHLLEAL